MALRPGSFVCPVCIIISALVLLQKKDKVEVRSGVAGVVVVRESKSKTQNHTLIKKPKRGCV